MTQSVVTASAIRFLKIPTAARRIVFVATVYVRNRLRMPPPVLRIVGCWAFVGMASATRIRKPVIRAILIAGRARTIAALPAAHRADRIRRSRHVCAPVIPSVVTPNGMASVFRKLAIWSAEYARWSAVTASAASERVRTAEPVNPTAINVPLPAAMRPVMTVNSAAISRTTVTFAGHVATESVRCMNLKVARRIVRREAAGIGSLFERVNGEPWD